MIMMKINYEYGNQLMLWIWMKIETWLCRTNRND